MTVLVVPGSVTVAEEMVEIVVVYTLVVPFSVVVAVTVDTGPEETMVVVRAVV